MNKILLSITVSILLLLVISCSQPEKKTFTVHIEIVGADIEMLTFQQRKDGDWVKTDSVMLTDGKASYTGAIDLPEMYYVFLDGQRNFIPLFLERGEVFVSADVQSLDKPVVIGSASHTVYESFNESLALFDEKAKTLSDQYRAAREGGDEITMKKIIDEYDLLDDLKSESIKEFALKTNNSVVAPFAMITYSYMFDLDALEAVSNALNPFISSSIYTVALNERIRVLKSVAVGQPFVDFTLNDPEGNPVSLASVANGNYVLVDFWASWCVPCRVENPNVVEAYNSFHDKGFEVFGVSFDKSHDKWIQAVEDDKLTWTHVSDLQFWSSTAGKLYGVKSIPHSVLLDREGIIIAKNLRGQELQDKLAELLN